MRNHPVNPFRSLLTRLAVSLLFILSLAAPGLAAGLLKPLNGGSPLAITSHQVEVVINNGFARTEIDQTFSNPADAPLEALYTFPLPKQASLSELSMWVAGQELVGEVVEKEKARQVYEAEKAAGKQAAITEKNDFKTFETRVGNIPPGGEVRIRLVYYQSLEIDLNVGRYLYPLAEGNVDEEQLQFWSVDDRVNGPFRFHLQLKSAFPVKDVRLPGLQNEAVINQAGGTGEQGNGNDYEVTIDRPAGSRLGRDIVFYYRLDDSIPGRVELIPYRPDDRHDGTFMLVVTPAADLKPLTAGTDWTFILDVSGSMGGNKIATLADGVSRVLGQLRGNDRFRLITFNTKARDLTGGFVPADPGRVQNWIRRVKTIQTGGGTNLFAGLKAGYRGLDADRTSATILVTDGVANVGETEHRAFLKLLKKYDIRLFTFVIGNSANQPLLDRLAEDSGGFAMNISDSDDISGRLLQAKAKVLHQCLRDVKLEIRGEQVQLDAPQTLGNLYAGQQLILFGRYSTPGEIGITLKAKISGREQSWRTTAMLPKVDTDNPELERLRALEKIEQTMQQIREQGETDALRSKVVDLGLNFSLVTDYTSMLVVTDDVLESNGIEKRNADRVQRERRAQQQKATRPAKSYRVDNQGQGAFGGRSAPGLGLGSGPVGPLGVALLAWLRRRRKQLK
ncbi:VIT domain-containing protein [Geothermobacter hydrogeniphilus]|uniref:VWA domain-containing protein n=1 Tax=Geothermobacter hydrogeniphilus TaxID=1969733 RepID=A0A1X0Y0T7_9BACT|nr:VIT domain-containing protein [Geothermobacter hydrogeniphilus]ORJ58698.1 VWA domain-containing protein [Geothermobacter hydrogeniphilus]